MEVRGPSSVESTFPIRDVRSVQDVAKPDEPKPVGRGDDVEISPAAKMLEELNSSSAVRAERLAQIKAAIEAGTYETPEKLEAALGRMLDEIGLEDEGDQRTGENR